MQFPLRLVFVGVVAVALLTSQTSLHADPGFGLLKKRKVSLQVRRPAAVRLANTTIAFRSGAANAAYGAVAKILEATLETELVSNERTLVKRSPGDAEWTVSLTVTGFSVPPPQRRTQPVKNSTALTFERWTGSLRVAYQVVDRGGRVHAADNVDASYDREFQTNAPTGGLKIPFIGGDGQTAPPSADELAQRLVKDVVQKIAVNLGNTVQPIEAQVAGGHDGLDRAADFMEQRLWARAIEELEKTPVFAKPKDESYRQYNLGLAYEAMSYEAKTYNEQRANLFKAQELYDSATEMNRDQRYFVEVVARLKDSIARYRTLDAMQRSDQKAPQTAATPAAPRPTDAGARPAEPATSSATRTTGLLPARRSTVAASPAPPAQAPKAAAQQGKPLTVQDVIEMHAAGVQHQQIVEVIRGSTVQFNLVDKDTVLAIARSKLPVELQNEMRKKVGMAPLTAPGSGKPPSR
jgi:hypothetical protein